MTGITLIPDFVLLAIAHILDYLKIKLSLFRIRLTTAETLVSSFGE